ncbi:MAG: hypothetical protein ACPGXK_09860 [Phycisphaerae bacterium]
MKSHVDSKLNRAKRWLTWLTVGAGALQAPVCTQEQIDQQIEAGLTAAFNIAAVGLADQLFNLSPDL